MSLLLGGHVYQQVHNSAAVSIFIVIPADPKYITQLCIHHRHTYPPLVYSFLSFTPNSSQAMYT